MFSLWRKWKTEKKLDAELQFHLDQAAADYVRGGMAPEEARRRARIEFGGVEQIKEEIRDVRGMPWIEDFFADLRYAARTLRRSPGFFAMAVLSLALGIGANTSIFTLFDALLLRPLPVDHPQRLYRLTFGLGSDAGAQNDFLKLVRTNAQTVSGVFTSAGGRSPLFLAMNGSEYRAIAGWAGGGQGVLGLRPAAGRLLTVDDDRPGAPPVAVISYRYWQSRLGADPAVIGRTFTTNGKVYTLVGVEPQAFLGLSPGEDPDVIFPLAPWFGPRRLYMDAMVRLKPGVTEAQAAAELNALYLPQIERRASGRPAKIRDKILAERITLNSGATGFQGSTRGRFAAPLRILLGVVSLVLLLACANLSGLALARAANRQQEISLRAAIGARRSRLLRQFLTESLLLTVLGGAAAMMLSRGFTRLLISMLANGGELRLPTTTDWRMLAYTAGVLLFTCLMVGLAPALHAVRVDVNRGIQEGRGRRRARLGRSLVVVQVAISMVLLAAASLFIGTLVNLYAVDAGIQRDGVLAFGVESPQQTGRGRARESEILAGVREMPNVSSAASASFLQIGSYGFYSVKIEGGLRDASNADVNFNKVSPGFFTTLGTRLVAGRDFATTDDAAAPKVAIISQSLARHYFGERSPLGAHINGEEIVGVVEDAKQSDLRQNSPETWYSALAQNEQTRAGVYLVRVQAGDPKEMIPAVEGIVHGVDPQLRLTAVETVSEHVYRSLLNERILAVLAGFFGILAMLLAGAGIFGVMAFQVSQRTHEFGIRIALGATRAGILGLALRDAGIILALGVALGAATAAAVTGIAKDLLFGLTPTDPAAFLSAAVLLICAGTVAGYIPARRAARSDPMTALRHE